MPYRLPIYFLITLLVATLDLLASTQIIRVGHFPNLTHPQAVAGHAFSRQGTGWFEKWLKAEITWHVFKAGPAAIEALLAGSIDLLYVGPTPAINAYLKSKGQAIRVISGACSGGSALLVSKASAITQNQDFKGKKIATPQLGNTQDVTARVWLKNQGFQISLYGGDVFVLPTTNADQISLFIKNEIDAAWTVEPWVSRLEIETGALLYLEEKNLWTKTGGQYATTLLISKADLLDKQPGLVKKWLKAHIALTTWLKSHSDQAKELINNELYAETRFKLPAKTLDRAWSRIDPTWNPLKDSLQIYADGLFESGFIRTKPSISNLCDLRLLNTVLAEENQPRIF